MFPMADWFLETGAYLIGVAVVPLVGLMLVCWGLWGDRSKGRPRCPKCWYDMRGTLPKLVCPECGYDARQQRRLYRNRRGWRRITLGLIVLVGIGSPWLYQSHVEAEFKTFMRARIAGQQFEVRQSRCLGMTSRRIRLWPILKSKLTGSYPYLSRIGDLHEKSYMQVAYFHGYWFNYCKLVRLERRELIAYWSLKEDRWHVLR